MTDHITIHPVEGRYVVRAGGAVIGETDRALELREGSYAPTIYVPREDIAMALLDRSPRATTCPWKGKASYFSVVLQSERLENAVWSYENPKPEMAAIGGHLAFYPDMVRVEPA